MIGYEGGGWIRMLFCGGLRRGAPVHHPEHLTGAGFRTRAAGYTPGLLLGLGVGLSFHHVEEGESLI